MLPGTIVIGIRKALPPLRVAKAVTSSPGPSLAPWLASTRMAMSLSSAISADLIAFGAAALADRRFNGNVADLFEAGEMGREQCLGRFGRLGAHHLANAEKLLKILAVDDGDQHHGATGAAHAVGGEGRGPRAFFALIDDDKKLTLIIFDLPQAPPRLPFPPSWLSHGGVGKSTRGRAERLLQP